MPAMKFLLTSTISRAQYGRYERGENLRFDCLMKIIAALDITVEEFFVRGFSSYPVCKLKIKS
jgi:transcriptional regulator with XRE-family HTH domain